MTNNKNIFWVDYSTFPISWGKEYKNKVFRNIDKNFKDLKNYDWIEKKGHNEIDFRFETNDKSIGEIVKMAYESLADSDYQFSERCTIEKLKSNINIVINLINGNPDLSYIEVKTYTVDRDYNVINKNSRAYCIDELDKVCEEADRLENKINKVDSFIKIENVETAEETTEIKKEAEDKEKSILMWLSGDDKNYLKVKRIVKKIFKEQITHSDTRRGITTASIETSEKITDFFNKFYYQAIAKIDREGQSYINCELSIINSVIDRIIIEKNEINIIVNNDHEKTWHTYGFTEIEKILKAIKDFEDGNYKTTITTPFLKVETKKETPKHTDNTQKQIALINEFIEFTRQKIKEARVLGNKELVIRFLNIIKNLKERLAEIKTKTNTVIYLNYKKQLLIENKDTSIINELSETKEIIKEKLRYINDIVEENDLLDDFNKFVKNKKRQFRKVFTDKEFENLFTGTEYFRKKRTKNYEIHHLNIMFLTRLQDKSYELKEQLKYC